MSRHNLTDLEWKTIRRFLPRERTGKAGRPWKSHRQVIDGIVFVLRTGIPWPDLPSEFGKFKTVYNRFRRWVKSGLWLKIIESLMGRLLKEGAIDFELWCVDGTVIRAHRVASGARKGELTSDENAEKHALGRSRGGYSTKLHFLTDARGIPLGVTATPGLMQACLVNTFRKEKRPDALAGDKGYSSKSIRDYISKLEINDVIPTRSNETPNDDFDKSLYRHRNIVERLIGWLKENRRIATRFDKTIDSYLAMIHIAIARMIINWD
jgi:transposase